MNASELLYASSGLLVPYTVKAPVAGVPRDRDALVLCAPLLQRGGGFLLCLPTGSVPPNLLASGLEAPASGLHGPSTVLEVPALEEDEEGVEEPTSDTLSVLVVDVDDTAAAHMAPYDPADGTSVVPFDPVLPHRFPEVGRLLALTRAWLRAQQDDRLGFYSAVEEGEAGLPEEEAPEAAPADPVGAKKAAAKAKRVTTNQLASQIDQLLSAMPRLTDQLQQLGARQQALEERVSAAPAGSTQRPKPAHQMPFFPPKNLTGAGGSASAFASYFGPPPKTGPAKAAAADQAPAHAAVSPEALDPEGADDPQSSSLQGALAQQGSALTLLVNHLIAQASENSGDFGGGAAGSSSLSSKGTARRDRLQAELAEHTGNFMLAVVQMGFRRMYPAGQQPRSLEEVRANPPPFRFQDYIERYGGYGQQRDLGLVAFMVSQIADLLISGEVEGALDSLSLLLVALEQAAQDSGKWEVAYALSMFPDPPSQVFQSRPSPHNARLRAWAPLCPAPWCTTTLAYLKEADAILARRTEALSSASRKTDASDKEEPKRPPRKPRFPRKPKQEGQ